MPNNHEHNSQYTDKQLDHKGSVQLETPSANTANAADELQRLDSTGDLPLEQDTHQAAPTERHPYESGEFVVSDKGVVYVENQGGKKRSTLICSELRIKAKTRNPSSGNWGILSRWKDEDGVAHSMTIALEQLEGDCVELRKKLASGGVHISPQRYGRDLFAAYLKTFPTKKRALCVDHVGWHKHCFVTPNETIGGTDDEVVVYQSNRVGESAMSTKGSTEDWRSSVAALFTGNTRLVFATSLALAGPLVGFAGCGSGGTHFRGPSSIGKSTALKAAASVYGDPSKFMHEWRATTNGLEGIAVAHNDLVLILDEINQADPREVGASAYLLANGQGKTRATRDGGARDTHRWQLLFATAGEQSLAAVMLEAGKKSRAGQEIRLADIDADAGAGLGIFENLHAFESADKMAQAIGEVTSRYHGAVGMGWLKLLVAKQETIAAFVTDGIRQFVTEHAPKDASGQVLRVAQRFGLIATAGELATHYGLTGWPSGESIKAAAACFNNWVENFGGATNREERALLDQVRAFFEQHGSSRFQTNESDYVSNRAGFKRQQGTGQYLVFTETFKKEICVGYDSKWAQRVLIDAGWIEPSNETPQRAQQKVPLPGMPGSKRVYVFTNKIGGDGEA